jgi:hypothetical protein
MADETPLAPNGSTEPAASLNAVAEALRDAPHLGPEARHALAELIDALDDPRAAVPATPEGERLLARAAHLLTAIRHEQDAGALAAARDRLEEAVLRVEAAAPVAAGAFHRFLDALADIGI